MIIKEFYNEETCEFKKLCAQLFHGKLSEGFEQTFSEYDSHRGGDFTRLGAFDDRLLGGLEIIPYTVSFDGHEIKMGGIGTFSSLILGRYDNIFLVPGLDIYGNEQNLKKLFRKKPAHAYRRAFLKTFLKH